MSLPDCITPPERSLSKASAASNPNFRYTADSVTVHVFRWRFTDSLPVLTDDQVRTVLDSVGRRFKRESNGKFKFLYVLHPGTWTFDKSGQGFSDWSSWNSWLGGQYSAAGFATPGATELRLSYGPDFGFSSSAANPDITIYEDGDGMNVPVVYHEAGHALGLLHGNGLEAGDKIIGVEDYAKENNEYGHLYCRMGSGRPRDYSVLYKHYMNWLDPSQVQAVTQSGVYRIHPNENSLPGKPVSLTVPTGNRKFTYWLQYVPGDAMTREGVLFALAGYIDNKPGAARYDRRFWDTVSYLLDMTPNSKDNASWWGNDMLDAALLLGKSFQDPFGGAKFTVVGVNQGVWDNNGWVDVQVDIPGSSRIMPRLAGEAGDGSLPVLLYDALGKQANPGRRRLILFDGKGGISQSLDRGRPSPE